MVVLRKTDVHVLRATAEREASSDVAADPQTGGVLGRERRGPGHPREDWPNRRCRCPCRRKTRTPSRFRRASPDAPTSIPCTRWRPARTNGSFARLRVRALVFSVWNTAPVSARRSSKTLHLVPTSMLCVFSGSRLTLFDGGVQGAQRGADVAGVRRRVERRAVAQVDAPVRRAACTRPRHAS